MSKVSCLPRRQEGVTSIYSLLPLFCDIIILKYFYYNIKWIFVTYSESQRTQWYYLFKNIYWLPMLLRSVHPTIIKPWKVHRVQAFTVWDEEKGEGSVLGMTGATQAVVIMLFYRNYQCSNSLSRITYAETSHCLF